MFDSMGLSAGIVPIATHGTAVRASATETVVRGRMLKEAGKEAIMVESLDGVRETT